MLGLHSNLNIVTIAADERTMFSNGKTCPKCNTESLHRSHRRGRDWFFNLIGFRPLRCTCCTRRFYARSRAVEQHRWA